MEQRELLPKSALSLGMGILVYLTEERSQGGRVGEKWEEVRKRYSRVIVKTSVLHKTKLKIKNPLPSIFLKSNQDLKMSYIPLY